MGNCCEPDGCRPGPGEKPELPPSVGVAEQLPVSDKHFCMFASDGPGKTSPERIGVDEAEAVRIGDKGNSLSKHRPNPQDDAYEPIECSIKPQIYKTVQVVVTKMHKNDELNIDVKHVWGRLVVHKVFEGGAIDRVNKEQRSRGLDSLEIGDVIVEINGKSLDSQMVQECQLQTELRIIAYRRPTAETS